MEISSKRVFVVRNEEGVLGALRCCAEYTDALLLVSR